MKVGITGNLKVYQIIESLIRILDEMSIEYVIDSDFKYFLKRGVLPFENLFKMNDIDILLIVGGDGTVLRKVKKMPKKNPPILGINTGTVGFLLEIKPEQIRDALTRIIKKKYYIDERSKLSVRLPSRKNFEVLNEFLITSYRIGKAIRLSVNDQDGQEIFRGRVDGLIVSSTTGSTGHALSAGGPIIDPKLDVILILTIASMTLFSRPIILPINSIISIKILSPKCVIIGDGWLMDILNKGDIIKVFRSPTKVKFIRFSKNFYEKIIRRSGGGNYILQEIG
ncbi:MAG: hypothetical protein DRJ34_02350 [Thermoprotei archaeon]|nr:MAG: hypothetical protein DRJ34_02350 [Thermoprotei archaeon]